MAKEPSKPQGPDARRTPPAAPRPTAPTLTDAAELEEARLRSIDEGDAPRRSTPRPASGGRASSALSLVNVRAPSVPAPTTISTKPTVSPAAPGPTLKPAEAPPEQDMTDRLALGDFTGALLVAERLLERDPEHRAARETADTCRTTLRKMYAARIGPLDQVVPTVAVAREQMRWLSIDHRAGFVLSLVDGVSTVEMILDVSGMPELDALRILAELVQQRIIALKWRAT